MSTDSHLDLVLALFWLPAVASAEPASFRFLSGLQSGSTTFQFEKTITESGTTATVESLLEWPLGMAFAGVEVANQTWRAQVLTNLLQSGQMADSDWITVPEENVPRTKFSYTESDVELRAYVVELAYRHHLNSPGPLGVTDLHIGYRHEHFTFDAYGAEGWMLGESGRMYGALADGIHALHYEVDHFLPYAGFVKGWAEARALVFHARDVDDHLLRSKVGTADAYGLGLGFIGRWRTRLPDWNAHLGAELEVQLLRSLSGSLHQEFYDDDPNSEANEKGMTFDSDFSTRSETLQARVGLEFPF